MKIIKTTPILNVESIETSLAFWVDTLSYQKTLEVIEPPDLVQKE